MTYYTIDFHGLVTISELKKRFHSIPKGPTVLKFFLRSSLDRLSNQDLEELAKLIPAQILTIETDYSSIDEKQLTSFCQALPPTIRSLRVYEKGLSANFFQMLHGKKLTSLSIGIPSNLNLTSLFANLPPVKLLSIKDLSIPSKELISALPVLPNTINCLDLPYHNFSSVEELINVLRALPSHITRIKLGRINIKGGVEEWRTVLAYSPGQTKN